MLATGLFGSRAAHPRSHRHLGSIVKEMLRLFAIIALDDHDIGPRLANAKLARLVVFGGAVACERSGKIRKFDDHETRAHLALHAFRLAAPDQKSCAVFAQWFGVRRDVGL